MTSPNSGIRDTEQGVACRPLAFLFHEARRSDIDSARLLEGIEYPLEHLLNKRARIEWAAMHRLMANAGEIWSEDELVAMGGSFTNSKYIRYVTVVARFLYTPMELYTTGMVGEKSIFAHMMPYFEVGYTEEGPHHIILDITMKPGFEPSRDLFLMILGGMKATPEVVGAVPAGVEMAEIEGGIRYEILVPDGGGILAKLWKAVTWPFSVRAVAGELREANTLLQDRFEDSERHLADLRQSEETIRSIVEGTASATGEAFFRSLVRSLGSALGARYAMITECTDSTRREVRTLAFWADGGFRENMVYGLAGTPCAGVIAGDSCFYGDSVQQKFPEDQDLVEMDAESFLGHPLLDASGEVIGHLVVLDDKPMEEDARKNSLLRIFGARAAAELQHKISQERLRSSEAMYRDFTESSPQSIFEMNTSGAITYANKRALDLFGYNHEELLDGGRRVFDLLIPEDRDRAVSNSMRTVQGELLGGSEYTVMRKDGSVFPIILHGEVTYRDGKPTGIRGVVTDLTKVKQAEAALRESEESYRVLAENISDIIWTMDLESRPLFVSASVETVLGYTPEEMQAIQGTGVMDEKGGEAITEALRAALSAHRADPYGANSVQTVEMKIKRKDGEEIWVETRFTLLKDDEGNVLGFQGSTNNISARKAAEAEAVILEDRLRQSYKMEAIGTLAGGIAHDFNNLLTGILGYANVLKLESKPGEPVYDAADVIETAGERASQLTKQLLGFARKGKLQDAPVDIHGSVQEVIALLSRTIDKNIVLSQRLRAPEFRIKGDAAQIQQVILNLAVNARDSMPEGGKLEFLTDNVVIGERDDTRPESVAPGEYLLLSVSDSGEGIPESIQDRIFEPFFTTKETGEGTGMGLATVYGIVENHGGFIELTSEVGEGTRFEIYFPLLVSDAARVPAEPSRRALVRGTESILVVDDEEIVRELAAEMLRTLGYEVEMACDGTEALDKYMAPEAHFDLVLLDMIMPQMGGKDCMRELKKVDPEVRAILSSGYGQDGAVQQVIEEGVQGFVQKPYRIDQLSGAVAAALGKLVDEAHPKPSPT